MVPSATVVLLLGAVVTAIMSAMGKCPVWVPAFLAIVVLMLLVLPR